MQTLKRIFYANFLCLFISGVAWASDGQSGLKHFMVQVTLSTPDHEVKTNEILELVAKHQGYFYSLTEKSIGLRIPNTRLQEIMESIEKMGEIVHKTILTKNLGREKAKQIAILNSRTQMQSDYLNIIAKSANRNELVEAEVAMRNIITELENAKGRLRKVNQDIRFGKMEVHFKAPEKITIKSRRTSPFAWINTISVGNTLRDFR